MRNYDIENSIGTLFLGNQKEIEKYYNAMDVFILPSRYEGLGIVLIEAQSTGLKCITSADVVPIEAKATDLLEYVSLNENEEYWAQKCINAFIESKEINRQKYSNEIEQSRYNIKIEAGHLAEILENTGA